MFNYNYYTLTSYRMFSYYAYYVGLIIWKLIICREVPVDIISKPRTYQNLRVILLIRYFISYYGLFERCKPYLRFISIVIITNIVSS